CSWLCFLFVCLFFLFVLYYFFMFFFFFSSRRRHTRCLSDWSSDVCSSDLLLLITARIISRDYLPEFSMPLIQGQGRRLTGTRNARAVLDQGIWDSSERDEIGRASCRERVEIWEGAGAVKTKKEGETKE